jgi:ferredoxin
MSAGEMNLDVEVDHKKCMGTRSCIMLAPKHFESGADGKALIRSGDGEPAAEGKLAGLTAAESNQVREAAMFCPPEAISVWDADTGEQYFP